MSRFPARSFGPFSFAVLCLALAPAWAEVSPERAGLAGAEGAAQVGDAGLAAVVAAQLRDVMPDQPIRVRTANAGLVLSGQVAGPGTMRRALALAEAHAPGRVSNLMTLGGQPQIELSLRLAAMPQATARNLSASMGAAGLFASLPGQGAGALPGVPTAGRDMPGLIDALEAKGVLRRVAAATLIVAAGRVTHLPEGQGCAAPPQGGIGMDVTPVLAEDGGIMVTLRTCLTGPAPGAEVDRSVTIRLRDGQTLAVADVLPDRLRDPDGISAALADEPTLGPLLASADYREGRTEVMVLITARTVVPGPLLPADSPPSTTGSGPILISGPAAQGPDVEAFTLSHHLLR